jgi:hypothetical protein
MKTHNAHFSKSGYPMPFSNKEPIIGERQIVVAHDTPIEVGDRLAGVFAGLLEQVHANTVYTVKEVIAIDKPKSPHHVGDVNVYTLNCTYQS